MPNFNERRWTEKERAALGWISRSRLAGGVAFALIAFGELGFEEKGLFSTTLTFILASLSFMTSWALTFFKERGDFVEGLLMPDSLREKAAWYAPPVLAFLFGIASGDQGLIFGIAAWCSGMYGVYLGQKGNSLLSSAEDEN